jgi:hypothetical protein
MTALKMNTTALCLKLIALCWLGLNLLACQEGGDTESMRATKEWCACIMEHKDSILLYENTPKIESYVLYVRDFCFEQMLDSTKYPFLYNYNYKYSFGDDYFSFSEEEWKDFGEKFSETVFRRECICPLLIRPDSLFFNRGSLDFSSKICEDYATEKSIFLQMP